MGASTNCAKNVEWTSSNKSSSIVLRELPSKLKSPHMMSLLTTSIAMVMRRFAYSTGNVDLLAEKGRYMMAKTRSRPGKADIDQLKLERGMNNNLIVLCLF